MLKTSPLDSTSDARVETTTEVELDSPRNALQRKPPRVVDISGEHLVGRPANETNPNLVNSIQDRHDKSTILHRSTDSEPDETAIREELRRILQSKTFSRAVQMSHLLEWITSRWLAGETDLLDGYHILMAVFHRTNNFQAAFDSTGRVYVGRLRAQLERYYAGEGAGSEVRIEIPLGKYIPVAHLRTSNVAKPVADHSGRRTVMVLPFRLVNSSDAWSRPGPLALTDHLISHLTRSRGLRVISRVSALGVDFGTDVRLLRQLFGAQFVIEGTVSHTIESCDFVVHLSETADGYNLWTGHYRMITASLTGLSKRIVGDLLRKTPMALDLAP